MYTTNKLTSFAAAALATAISVGSFAQNICMSIGADSLLLINNGYITGPANINCGQNVHTETKWINVTGADSLHVNTFQHRLYDESRIYDANNSLIWNWDGENGSPTWYIRKHSVYVGGNDSVRIEFYQGYPDPFCNGYLQVVRMSCAEVQNVCEAIGSDSLSLINNGYITGPANINCGQNVHTDTKWINVTGADSLHVNTFQHRLYDESRIYDANNSLIWNWDGENGSPTWYLRGHSVYVGGNDSVRIEFYQGYPDPFCNGYLQVTSMSCGGFTTSIDYHPVASGLLVYPNPNDGHVLWEAELNGLVSVQVFDARGALVHNEVFTASGTRTQYSLDLSTLAKGLYTLQVQNNGGSVTEPVVVD